MKLTWSRGRRASRTTSIVSFLGCCQDVSIILRNYHSRSSVVRDDEAIQTLAETEDVWAKIRICRVAKTSEIRKQSFPGSRVAVAILVCWSSLMSTTTMVMFVVMITVVVVVVIVTRLIVVMLHILLCSLCSGSLVDWVFCAVRRTIRVSEIVQGVDGRLILRQNNTTDQRVDHLDRIAPCCLSFLRSPPRFFVCLCVCYAASAL